ncbi:MAG TPA: tripartite tricarboxylate transporter substrate-binding protein [Xanthobacteraceae bacterium]|nr:tripartite tricarboxylate transporter substrate-binding protein [Xanthobacteraceae bacterium]
MDLHRRRFLKLTAAALALPAASRAARARAYPTRPVHLLVGWAPGGFSDITARLIGPWLSDRLGQQFLVENRPGASSNIATAAVARAAPDGYTLLQIGDSNAFSAALYDKLSFNFIRDITPVASIDRAPFAMVVNPSSPIKTVTEFIAYAKANAGKINMGASGPGSPSQLYGELFKTMTGIDMLAVQYRGVGVALPDLLSGRVDVIFLPVATAVGQIGAGKLRPLGVTSSTRVGALPDVPTVGESVPGYAAAGWTGIGVPANTPPEIVAILNQHVNAALADAAFKAQLAKLGLEPFASTPAELAKFITEETEKWGRVIRTAGIKAE